MELLCAQGRGGIWQNGCLVVESALLKTKRESNYAWETKKTISEKLQNQTFKLKVGKLSWKPAKPMSSSGKVGTRKKMKEKTVHQPVMFGKPAYGNHQVQRPNSTWKSSWWRHAMIPHCWHLPREPCSKWVGKWSVYYSRPIWQDSQRRLKQQLFW